MHTIQSRVVVAGLFFLFIFLSGYWLSQLGKPYHTLVITLHKLIGLAAGVFLVLTVIRTHQAAPLSGLEIAAVVITALIFVGTVAAGGLLSIDAAGGLSGISQPVRQLIAVAHRLFPFLAVLSTAMTLYLIRSS